MPALAELPNFRCLAIKIIPYLVLSALAVLEVSAQVAIDSTFAVRPDSATAIKLQQLDSIRSETAHEYRTFKHSYDSVNYSAGSAIERLQSKVDSLTQLNMPAPGWLQKIDSVQQARQAAIENLETKWQEKRNKHTSGIRELNLPPPWDRPQQGLLSATEKLDLSLPSAEFSLPDFSLENPGLNLPALESPLGSIDLNKPQIPGMPDELGQLKQYTDQAKAIKEGKVDEVLDRQLANIDEIQELQKQQSQFQMPEMNVGKAKQQYLSLAKTAAKEHFAEKFDQVDNALQGMSKLKKKYNSVQSAKDLPKRRPNEMKDKSFVERLVPALGLQLMQRNIWMLDANPSLGYRFNQYFSAGVGWNQRWAHDFDKKRYRHDERLYGPRVYSEYKLKRGLGLRAESDYVNALIRTRFNEPVGREWVWNVLAGLRKDYKISRNINGHLQLMYNLINPENRSPYPRFNLRIGFEFRLTRLKMPEPDIDL